ncbi:Cytokinesis protein [Yarrowia sp. E02]|nr:Cytokinesis protein [Yarrowia sp. E02]
MVPSTPSRRPQRPGGAPQHLRQSSGSSSSSSGSNRDRDMVSATPAQKVNGKEPMNNYTLGDCLGKGAYASVYRALNWNTGEAVAVKRIKLSDVPKKGDVDTIMMEIDLLKNLNHPNIVKYHGFVKTQDTLNIILEYCENGSLHSICRKFGKFPENLVAVYMYQVLKGLAYLHEQGVIHRDIKGANILTTKDGNSKLADFGVATTTILATGTVENGVAGTPNWMAPEIIELNGATTASDIWSVGCTVIELLTGKPPYHNLGQMPAMFAIVNDDHPAFPEGASPAALDFLGQCFQKDPNLRVTAKKLLRHPWLAEARTDSERKHVSGPPKRYDEVVKSVEQFNQAVVETPRTPHRTQDDIYASIRKFSRQKQNEITSSGHIESWDDEFVGELNPRSPHIIITKREITPPGTTSSSRPIPSITSALNKVSRGVSKKLTGINKATRLEPKKAAHSNISIENSPFRDVEDDDAFADDFNVADISTDDLKKRFNSRHQPSGAADKSTDYATVKLKQFCEDGEDEDDYTDMLGDMVDLAVGELAVGATPKSQNAYPASFTSSDKSHHSDDEDPFAALENETRFSPEDIQQNIARDKLATAMRTAEQHVGRLNRVQLSTSEVQDIVPSLIDLLQQHPETKKTVVKCHIVLPLLELLERFQTNEAVVCGVLCILVLLIDDDEAVLESLCFSGGIPIVTMFSTTRYQSETRVQSVAIVDRLCRGSKLALQMFVSCGGLNMLSQLIEEDFGLHREFVFVGIYGVAKVFEVQGSGMRNDFCRILSRSFILDSLVAILRQLVDDYEPDEYPTDTSGYSDTDYINKIMSILTIFSQTEPHVKETIASRAVFKGLFKCYKRLPTHHRVTMLKFIKSVSAVHTALETMQNSNVIEYLVDCLKDCTDMSNQSSRDLSIQIYHTLFNLCRLSPHRQDEAAECGAAPYLQSAALSSLPVKDFALPLLCDMAHSSKATRKILWRHDVLTTYLRLLPDPYYQVNAMDSIIVWFDDETARVEERLIRNTSLELITHSFSNNSRSTAFEQYMDLFHKLLRQSQRVAVALTGPILIGFLSAKLESSKPRIRLTVLKIIRTLVEANGDDYGFLAKHGLAKQIAYLAANEKSVLARGLAKEMAEGKKVTSTDTITDMPAPPVKSHTADVSDAHRKLQSYR